MIPHGDDDPDLPAGPGDSAMASLIADLERVYTEAIPPDRRAMIARVLYRHAHRQHAPPLRRFQLPHWPRWQTIVAAVVLIAIIVAGGAYAATSLVDQALNYEANTGTAGIAQRNLGENLNLSQSVCGFTMRVQRVYADANRVVIGYAVSGPSGRHFINGFYAAPTLAVEGGRELPRQSGAGAGMDGNETGSYWSYDASAVAGNAKTLRLHLTVPYVQTTETLTTRDPAPVVCETYSHVRETVMEGKPTRWVEVGPFAFDLTVPVTTSVRVVEPHLTGQSNAGTAVTLERIVVTPSETRVYLRGLPSAGTDAADLLATLDAAGQKLHPEGVAPSNNGQWVYDFDAYLYDTRGDWRITVLTNLKTTTDGFRKYTGTVTFHVTMP